MRNATQLSLGVVLAAAASADVSHAAEHPIGAGFYLSKNDLKNQVYFAIEVDAACTPVGARPVRAYWKMLEEGPYAVAPLAREDEPAYGIARQIASSHENGGSVRLVLRALPARALNVNIVKTTLGTCRAEAVTTIEAQPAILHNLHIAFRGNVVVSAIATGSSKTTGRTVREIIRP
jgi:hypothetical protein